MGSAPEDRTTWGERGVWLLVVAAWLALTKLVPNHSAKLLPASVRQALTLDLYLMLSLLVSTGLGVGLFLLIKRRPGAALGLKQLPGGRGAALAGLLVPLIFVLGLGLGIYVALPVLLEEFQRGGAQVSRQNLGEFGRVVKEQPLLLTALWVVVIAPTGEELLFRGALWGSLRELTQSTEEEAPKSASEATLEGVIEDGFPVRAGRWFVRWMKEGGLATLLTTGIFGMMHLGTPGGAGIIMVVSSLVLGLALGLARQISGGLWLPLAMHAGYNFLGLGHSRNWFVSETFPKDFGVPRLLSMAALLGLFAALGVGLLVRRRNAPET